MAAPPISVLYFTNTVVRAGVEEHILTLLRSLDRLRFRLHLVCSRELGEELRHDLPADVELVPLLLERPSQLAALRRLARILRDRRVDVLHSHLFQSSRVASPVGWACRVPVIVETPHVRENWRQGWLKGNFAVDRFVDRFVDCYVAVSEANARYLAGEKGFPSRKIVTIHNGVDLARFRPATAPPGMKRSLGFDDGDPVIVVLARLEPQKGHHVLFEALPLIRREFAAVRLVCVGDGSLRSDLDALTRSSDFEDAVRFVGYQGNAVDWLALADFTVLPSHFEGLPIAAIESLAMGKPVVASDVDGTGEVVVDGKTGLTVPPGQPYRLAEAVCRLLRDPDLGRRLGHGGREWVIQHFSQEQQVRKTGELYLEALRRSTGVDRKRDLVPAEQGNRHSAAGPVSSAGHLLSMTFPEARVLRSGGPRSTDSHDVAALGATVRERAAGICARRYAGHLRAVILTGSLARHEASWVREDKGWRLLGDAEFLLVFKPGSALPSEAIQRSVEQELQADLAGQRIFAHVQLSAVHRRFFERLRPRIFACELRAWGAAVWGDGSVISLIPPFSVADIPMEDGWRLLANRMIEHLEATADVEACNGPLPERLRYCTVKLCLDMATSLTVFSGFYTPSYRERQQRLTAVSKEGGAGRDWPFPVASFADQVALATQFKLDPTPERSAAIGWEFWRQALHDSKLLWNWELAHLAYVPVKLDVPPGCDLMGRWMRLQPISQRLRGWLFVARALGWQRSVRWWPRWVGLSTAGSPRYWVYDGAMTLFAQLPEALEAGAGSSAAPAIAQSVVAVLPVVRRNAAGNSAWRWTDLVSEVAWNYHRFLEPTRA